MKKRRKERKQNEEKLIIVGQQAKYYSLSLSGKWPGAGGKCGVARGYIPINSTSCSLQGTCVCARSFVCGRAIGRYVYYKIGMYIKTILAWINNS